MSYCASIFFVGVYGQLDLFAVDDLGSYDDRLWLLMTVYASLNELLFAVLVFLTP